MFININFMLGQKSSINFEDEIIQSMLSDHSGIKLEIKNKRYLTNSQLLETRQLFLHNPLVKEEIIEKNKKILLNSRIMKI